MAIPVDASMGALPPPGYFIYRDSPLGQYDAAAPPVFYPPKDSDELFDALRTKFPLVKTHSERMRDALFEFLMEERQTEALSASTSTSPNMPLLDSLDTSPWQQSWPSMSSGSASASPEMLATPSFGESPQQQHRHSSQAFSTTGSTQPSTPQIEDMTGVFSLSTSAQPKQRLRRKMTEAEKIEYHKRRIVKACDKCAKRKRKCQHNQPEMESMSTKTGNKVAKSRSSPSTKSANSTTPKTEDLQMPIDFDSFSSEQLFDTDMQLFDDFTTFFDEPLLDFENTHFDNFVSPSAYAFARPRDISVPSTSLVEDQLRWNDGHDFNLDFLSADGNAPQSSNAQNHTPDVQAARHAVNARHTVNVTQSGIASADLSDHSADLAEQPSTALHAHSRTHTHVSRGTASHPDTRQQHSSSDIAGDQLFKSIEIPQPTHTVHVHDRDSYASDSQGASCSVSSQSQSPPSQSVSRLIGTSKAVRTPGNLLNAPPSSPIRPISLGGVAPAIDLTSPVTPVVAHTRAQVPGRNNKENVVPSRFKNGTSDKEADQSFKWNDSHPVLRNVSLTNEEVDLDAGSCSSISSDGDGALESTPVGGAIRAHHSTPAGTEKGDRASSSVPGLRRSGLAPASLEGATSDSQVSTSVPGNSRSRRVGLSAAHQGRPPMSSHEEGIVNTVSPSQELYRLKKRIPSALGKPQDRSNKGLPPLNSTGLLPVLPASSSAPSLLQTIPAGQVKNELSSPVSLTFTEARGNGGAYPRLDTDNNARPLRITSRTEETTAEANGLREPSSGKNHVSRSATPFADRLMDHVRYRDHHGRTAGAGALFGFAVLQRGAPKSVSASAAGAVLLVLAAACLLTSIFKSLDLTLLAFALVAPVAADKVSYGTRSSALCSTDGALQKKCVGVMKLEDGLRAIDHV